MATITAKEVVVTWDGDPVTWPDYSRKVRLQWEKTQPHKRRQLGPDLASRLTGRAWGVTADLDHRQLAKRNGTKYLLRVLRDRLCRTAVPDAGARLEDLLIRLRRPLGMTMSQWSTEVMESYRKVQRALMRAQQQRRDKSPKKEKTKDKAESVSARSEPQAEPPSPVRSTSGRSPTARARTEASQTEETGEGYETLPQEDPDDAPREWTDEEWKQWYKDRRRLWDEDSSSSGEDLPWDELEVEELKVLPDEILGWLLLRRANLSASSRLSVQASVQNSLNFRDIEMALRDQEEELLQADQQRHQPRKRTFWVEEQGQWGLLTMPEDNHTTDILWVGDRLPPEVYGHDPSDGALPGTSENEDIYWNYDYDGWHGYVQDGQGYWLETDGMGTYWSAEDDGWDDLSPEESKELNEAYAAYEAKARTFMQSRQLQRAKGKSRGFYPVGMLKGKSKGKGKTKKGKGMGTTSHSSSMSLPASTFSAQGDVMAANGNVGCFICGDRGHGFRQCPKRNNTGSPSSHQNKGTKKGTFWVEAVTPSSLAFVGMVTSSTTRILDTTGYGVLDLGATETVGSLEALEGLMALRHLQAGEDEEIQVFTGPTVNKPFRFGNGGIKFSESYVLIPQRLGEARVMLGLYTIDANKVPILIGMKTLEKLGAIIDVQGQCMVLANVAPDFKIPLGKSHAGHLLVDLTSDWLSVGQPLKAQPVGVYKVQAAEVGRRVDLSEKVETTCMSTSSAWMAEAVDDQADEQHEASGEEGEIGEHTTVFMLDPHDHSRQPLVQADQTMRDGIIQALISTSSSTPAALLSHGAQEGHQHQEDSSTRGEVRLQQDGSDEPERSSGHRSSMSRRARSPLPSDVNKQMEEKKPAQGSMDLQNKKISLDAAERSLQDRLSTIQKQKEDWINMQEKKNLYAKKVKEEATNQRDGGYPKGPSGHDKTPSTSMPSQVGGNVQDHTMSQTPGRKAIRKAEMTSEEKEFIEKKEEEEDWQKDYIVFYVKTPAEHYIAFYVEATAELCILKSAIRKAEMTSEEKEFIEKKEEEEDWQKDYIAFYVKTPAEHYIAFYFEATAELYILKSFDILEETYGWWSGF
eukprot:s567_g28.t1